MEKTFTHKEALEDGTTKIGKTIQKGLKAAEVSVELIKLKKTKKERK